MASCLFCSIAAGDIPCTEVFADDDFLAFRDIDPKAPTHVLVIPRRHISTVNHLEEEDRGLVGDLYLAAKAIAAEEGIAESGYRAVMNCNEGAGQSVFHIHLHVLGGRGLTWPPG